MRLSARPAFLSRVLAITILIQAAPLLGVYDASYNFSASTCP